MGLNDALNNLYEQRNLLVANQRAMKLFQNNWQITFFGSWSGQQLMRFLSILCILAAMAVLGVYFYYIEYQEDLIRSFLSEEITNNKP